MVYSKDEKAKMARLLEVFQSFIQEQSYFDIVYSEKIGYLRIVLGTELADDLVFRISGFDELLKVLADDMLFERLQAKATQAPSPEDLEAIYHLFESNLPFSPEENRRCMEFIESNLTNWEQDMLFVGQ